MSDDELMQLLHERRSARVLALEEKERAEQQRLELHSPVEEEAND